MLATLTRTHTHTHTRTHTHTCAHTQARTHTHTYAHHAHTPQRTGEREAVSWFKQPQPDLDLTPLFQPSSPASNPGPLSHPSVALPSLSTASEAWTKAGAYYYRAIARMYKVRCQSGRATTFCGFSCRLLSCSHPMRNPCPAQRQNYPSCYTSNKLLQASSSTCFFCCSREAAAVTEFPQNRVCGVCYRVIILAALAQLQITSLFPLTHLSSTCCLLFVHACSCGRPLLLPTRTSAWQSVQQHSATASICCCSCAGSGLHWDRCVRRVGVLVYVSCSLYV